MASSYSTTTVATSREKVLDLAAGTAVSTVELAKSGARLVACDFSQGMLTAGWDRHVPKVVGDGMKLPFADATFDAVTISFGLRNIQDFQVGLRELARVTRPGGRLTFAEFSTPVVPVFGRLYGGCIKSISCNCCQRLRVWFRQIQKRMSIWRNQFGRSQIKRSSQLRLSTQVGRIVVGKTSLLALRPFTRQ